MLTAKRWGDYDRYFGPITYSRDRGDVLLAGEIDSGDDDDYPGCYARVHLLGHTVILALPQIIRPYREKYVATSWNAATVERMGRDWYWQTERRRYGFYATKTGYVNVSYGRSTHDSRTDMSRGHFLGFAQWRHVRHSLYDTDGKHWWTYPQRGGAMRGAWVAQQAAEKACPSVTFDFDDYDGERIQAKTRIEETEWLFGSGWFRWLSVFLRPRVRRSLDIDFSREVGPRKGSWKGGTVGHGIDMLPGETCEDAFLRYCEGHNLKFRGAAEPEPRP